MDLARQEAEPLRILRGLAGAILTLPVTQDFVVTDFVAASAAAAEGRALAEEIGHVRLLGRFTAWKLAVSGGTQATAVAIRLGLAPY
jgi:hypothetical protein